MNYTISTFICHIFTFVPLLLCLSIFLILFNLRQYGFITGWSKTLQLLKVLDDWTEILDNGDQVDVLYMDFMKAFDQVPHKHLINKLYSYGIRSNMTFCLREHILLLSMAVFSDWAPVLSGIPQRGVLGSNIICITYQ